VRDHLGHALVSRLRNQHAWILLAPVASQGRLRHHRNRQDRHHTSHQSHSHRCLPPIVSSPARPVFTRVKLLMCQGTRWDSTIWITSVEWKKYTGCGFLTFPTKVPSDSLGWIGSLKRTSDKSLFPMALGSCGHQRFLLNLSCERKTICNMLFGNWLWKQTRSSYCTLSMLLVLYT